MPSGIILECISTGTVVPSGRSRFRSVTTVSPAFSRSYLNGRAFNSSVSNKSRARKPSNDPNGRPAEFSGFYGAKDGQVEINFDLAPNDATGLWRLHVTELASGREAEAYVRVTMHRLQISRWRRRAVIREDAVERLPAGRLADHARGESDPAFERSVAEAILVGCIPFSSPPPYQPRR